jgi:hypothetical protein
MQKSMNGIRDPDEIFLMAHGPWIIHKISKFLKISGTGAHACHGPK